MRQVNKVLYISSVYKPNIGGVETTINKLTKNLKRKRVSTVVLTKRFPFNLPEKEALDNSLVLRINRPKNSFGYIKSIKLLKRYLDYLKADIIHLIGIRRPMPLYGLLLSRLWQVPYVVTLAGGDIPDINEPATIRIWQEGENIVPQSILQADKLTAFSQYTARLAVKTISGLPRIKVIYGGVDLDEIKKTPRHIEKFNYFFAARRLDSSKGIDILIRAYHKYKKNLSKTKLLIAGEGPDKQALLQLISNLKQRKNIILLGPLTHEQVLSYMKSAIAHVCPSRTESGGIVNYEAQAAGCLAIGSNAGGIPEYIKNNDTGFTFPVEDINALARLLLLAVENKKQIKEVRNKAKNAAFKKTWNKTSTTYLRIYNSLLKKHKYTPFRPWSNLSKRMWKELIQ